VRFHHTLPFMTKQTSQFGCGYLQTAQKVTKSLILNSNQSRISLSTQIVSFSPNLWSRRDERVDKPMPKQRLLGKVTSKIQTKYICIEQNQNYTYSVVIIKLAESQTCREIINDTQCNIGI